MIQSEVCPPIQMDGGGELVIDGSDHMSKLHTPPQTQEADLLPPIAEPAGRNGHGMAMPSHASLCLLPGVCRWPGST